MGQTPPLIEQPPNTKRATDFALGATIVAAVNSVLALVISFGVNLTASQQVEIAQVVNALVLLVVAASHAYGQLTAERSRWTHLNGPEG